MNKFALLVVASVFCLAAVGCTPAVSADTQAPLEAPRSSVASQVPAKPDEAVPAPVEEVSDSPVLVDEEGIDGLWAGKVVMVGNPSARHLLECMEDLEGHGAIAWKEGDPSPDLVLADGVGGTFTLKNAATRQEILWGPTYAAARDTLIAVANAKVTTMIDEADRTLEGGDTQTTEYPQMFLGHLKLAVDGKELPMRQKPIEHLVGFAEITEVDCRESVAGHISEWFREEYTPSPSEVRYTEPPIDAATSAMREMLRQSIDTTWNLSFPWERLKYLEQRGKAKLEGVYLFGMRVADSNGISTDLLSESGNPTAYRSSSPNDIDDRLPASDIDTCFHEMLVRKLGERPDPYEQYPELQQQP